MNSLNKSIPFMIRQACYERNQQQAKAWEENFSGCVRESKGLIMILILKRIPASTLLDDIEDFLRPAVKGGFLKKAGKIERISIQVLRQAGDHQRIEYHALVRVSPDKIGKRIIKMLDRKPLNGKRINVCEYQFRHRDNDRRLLSQGVGHEMRKADRRRRNLEVMDVSSQRKSESVDYTQLNWAADETKA